jgi:tyrosinase
MLSRSLLTVLSLAVATASCATIPRAADSTAPASTPTPVAGTCTDPIVRKEWRELTDAEKDEYLRAAVCVRNLPKQRYSHIAAATSRLDDFVYTHFSLNLDIHFVANFLPWHRWFLQLHEDMLRNECGYEGHQPYWDWSIDADATDMPNSPIWDAEHGFGGDGKRTGSDVPGFERCVVDGPFANSNLTLAMGWPNMNDAGDRLHCFTREFNGGLGLDENGEQILGDMQSTAYNTRVMKTVNNFDNYVNMSEMLEGLPHAQSQSRPVFPLIDESPANKLNSP